MEAFVIRIYVPPYRFKKNIRQVVYYVSRRVPVINFNHSIGIGLLWGGGASGRATRDPLEHIRRNKKGKNAVDKNYHILLAR